MTTSLPSCLVLTLALLTSSSLIPLTGSRLVVQASGPVLSTTITTETMWNPPALLLCLSLRTDFESPKFGQTYSSFATLISSLSSRHPQPIWDGQYFAGPSFG